MRLQAQHIGQDLFYEAPVIEAGRLRRNWSGADMAPDLTRQEVRTLLHRARESFPHNACSTCECFLGYAAQIGIDAGEDLRSLLAEMGLERTHTHSCLGCDPCPPADLFAAYLQERDQRSEARSTS